MLNQQKLLNFRESKFLFAFALTALFGNLKKDFYLKKIEWNQDKIKIHSINQT